MVVMVTIVLYLPIAVSGIANRVLSVATLNQP